MSNEFLDTMLEGSSAQICDQKHSEAGGQFLALLTPIRYAAAVYLFAKSTWNSKLTCTLLFTKISLSKPGGYERILPI